MRKKWWIILSIAVVIGIGVFSIRSCGKKKLATALAQPATEEYVVKRGKIVSKVEITGEIQPQTVVQIKSKVSGKIVKFYVDENDYVKSGQIIADVEPDYNQANTLSGVKSRLQLGEIRLKNAQKDVADKQTLLGQNYITQKEFDTAKDELDSAQIEYASALQQYELVKELDTKGKVIHVYATAAGTVIQRPVQEGEMIISSNSSYGEGSVVVKVADLSRMIVKSNINEVDIAKFKLGQTATIKVDALPYAEYSGKITKIAPMAITENSARVFPVEISLLKSDTQLKPGMTGNVSILGETRDNVLVIPIRGVFSDDKNQDVVYLIKADKANSAAKPTSVKGKNAKLAAGMPAAVQTTATPVKLGSNDLQNVEVVAGINEGDKISLTEPASAGKMEMNFERF
jgi:HlyD family secretion protein